jgi:thiamine biosynthesis lipoprotein
MALNEAIARGEKDIATTAEIAGLIEDATRLSERSAGLFNPAIGKLVALWSFHRDQPGGPLPDPADIARIVEAHPRMADLAVRGRTLRSSNSAVRLDFGGYAKGYALDRAAAILRESGVANALVNIGGNIRARLARRRALGASVWRIGAGARRAPALARLNWPTARRSNLRRLPQVLHRAASATLISSIRAAAIPRTGIRSVTVVVPPRPGAGALSDAASKPLFIAGSSGWREAAERLGITQALLVDDEGGVHVTPELAQRLRGRDVEAQGRIGLAEKQRGHVR